MNIRNEFTEPECEKFRRECNFTPDELIIFNLRVQGMLVVEIQMKLQERNMHMSKSTVERRLQNIKKKIIKVI